MIKNEYDLTVICAGRAKDNAPEKYIHFHSEDGRSSALDRCSNLTLHSSSKRRRIVTTASFVKRW